MAHLQGNKPGDDPNKYGLKFDSEKPRWELMPMEELKDIISYFGMFLPNGEPRIYDLDITKEVNKDDLLNKIFDKIIEWRSGVERSKYGFPRGRILSVVAFECFFFLRDKPYTKEELDKSSSDHRWDLIDMKDVEGVVDVFTKGAMKYADNNWQKVSSERYFGALIRHFSTLRTPDRYDPELGVLHMYQVIWNLIALMWLEKRSTIPEDLLKTASKLSGVKISLKAQKKKAAKKTAKKTIKKKKH